MQGITECAAICLMRRKNFRSARRELVMKPHGGGVKLAQGYRITEIVKKKTRLVGDAIEGKRFDAQTRFFRRAVTSRFGGAQFVITPEEAFYAGCVACPARHGALAANRQHAEDARIEQTANECFFCLTVELLIFWRPLRLGG